MAIRAARARAPPGSGVRAVYGAWSGFGVVRSRGRPSSDTLFQATGPRARRPRTPARAADHTTPSYTAVSVTDTRHTQYTFSTHGTAVFYVPHVKHSAVTWFTRRVRLAKAGPQWPRPRDGRKRAQTRLPAPSRTDVTDVNGCYRMVYDVVCTGAVLLFAGVVSLHRVAISSAISSRSASDSN